MNIHAITAPPALLDPSDVPAADPAHLMRLMSILIRNGHGLVLLDGAKQAALDAAETEFWDATDLGSQARIAAIVRFRALLQACAAERLQDLFLERGLALLPDLFQAAATMRLNTRRGFNRQSLLWRITGKRPPHAVIQEADHPAQRGTHSVVASPAAGSFHHRGGLQPILTGNTFGLRASAEAHRPRSGITPNVAAVF
jgi:hypothetical protein